ncbi:MAG TPA: bifunctional acetate--CoA ligase family protein/GNAT family N-acetyltransferase [Verrucomicrobiae bacterium]|nr:bifunctional acetate--CoA ligase family protein/GNAT family N-acetyltransferase [Verrucomicrobiae bacterium]
MKKRDVKLTTDPAHDIYRYGRPSLDPFFSPATVAVIGATEKEGSVGRTIVRNLITSSFGGTVYPVNPNRPSVLSIRAYRRITDIPEPIDLAVIVTPAQTVPGIIGECVDAGVKAAIVISAGFKETGADGVELERQILERARRGNLRVIGPNCLGVMRPPQGLNATFAGGLAHAGSVGFISQSGALCAAVLDWSLREKVGFSAFISIGSMLDVGWGDLIDYLGSDPKTHSIVIYMETIGDARAFLSAAREVALSKPIIVIKPGRSEAAAKAAASHTGSLTGSDEVLEAAFRRCGVLRVNAIAEVFYMAEILAKQPRPKGQRLTIVTNAGGPGVLATDALLANGGELTELSKDTMGALNQILPAAWSHNNPIDVLGDAGADRYAKAIEIAAKDPGTDGLLVVLTPQAMTEATQTAELMKPYAKAFGKPVLASWMGADDVAGGVEILNQAGIPTFPYPDTAARMFGYMCRHLYALRALYETPALPRGGDEDAPDTARATKLVGQARQSGRTLLTEFESKQLLVAYGIPTIEMRIAKSESEAVKAGEKIGYPLVLKLHSETITHKTDVGGVQLNLANARDVKRAFTSIRKSVTEKAGAEHFLGVTVQPMVKLDGYELILGSSIDPQFGPVLLFGAGGQLVEVFQDRSLALPPLNATLARRLIERTRIFTALKGVRGRAPVDLAALEQLLVRFSQLVIEQPWIKEIDINPLMASPERLVALDARIVVQESGVTEEQLPKPAIRPYPSQYIWRAKLKDKTPVTIRPIRPEDEPLLVDFHHTLSEESVYMRYFHMIALEQRVTHERLTRICFNDYDREMALVAVQKETKTSPRRILGVGRLSREPHTDTAHFAVLISDKFQRRGLGTELLGRLVQIGREEKLRRITAEILPENIGMQTVAERIHFKLKHSAGEAMVRAELILQAA